MVSGEPPLLVQTADGCCEEAVVVVAVALEPDADAVVVAADRVWPLALLAHPARTRSRMMAGNNQARSQTGR